MRYWYASKYSFLEGLTPYEAIQVLLARINILRQYLQAAMSMAEPNRQAIATMLAKLKAYVKDARDIQSQFKVPIGFGFSDL